MEQQLIELHEKSALLKQELSQLKTKHWRIEKELENANIDKRILQRESKEYEKQIKMLNSEIENLKKQNEEKNIKITVMSEEIQQLKQRVKDLENDCTKVTAIESKLQEKQNEIRNLEIDLKKVINEREILEQNYDVLKKETIDLQQILNVLKNEKTTQNDLLKNKEKELENTRLNLNALRDACVVLENQLIEYERLYDTVCEKQRADNLIKEELLQVKRLLNEEKSFRLLAENKFKRAGDDLELIQKERDEIQSRYEELKVNMKDLTEEMNVLQEKVNDFTVDVNVKERTIQELLLEIKYLKENSSSKTTVMHNLRETNCELKRKLDETEKLNKQLMEQIVELEQILDEKINFYSEKEIKTEATLQQQIKLIDYLQNKIEELGNNKKKSFAEKLFSHSKKENQPPVNYNKDLEAQLSRERQKNKILREEIDVLKKRLVPIQEDTISLEGWINIINR